MAAMSLIVNVLKVLETIREVVVSYVFAHFLFSVFSGPFLFSEKSFSKRLFKYIKPLNPKSYNNSWF